MKYYLGIDGGGSKTTAVVFDENGSFIKKEVGESINYYSVGLENARSNMNAIIASLGFDRFESAFIGMSALNERADNETTERFAGGIINAKKVTMDSDLYIALEAMLEDGECAVIISGTGSMAVMKDSCGSIRHAGGWGYILGDEGSGYAIGLDGIKAAIRASEGGNETALLSECLRHFGIKNIYELIDLYYDKGVERKVTAAFAESVFAHASGGDKASLGIIDYQAEALAATAKALIGQSRCKIGLWGGIFQHNELFRKKFAEKSGFSASLLPLSPEQGAVIAAMKESGFPLSDEIKNNIKVTYNHE